MLTMTYNQALSLALSDGLLWSIVQLGYKRFPMIMTDRNRFIAPVSHLQF